MNKLKNVFHDSVPGLVSIIIPVFNRAGMIGDCLGSLRDQHYEQWEAIVVDDGSTDASADMVKEMSLEDSRIKLYQRSEGKKGGNVCRNTGLRKARGEYIIFLDSDDLLRPFALKQRVKLMNNYQAFTFVVTPGAIFTRNPSSPDYYWNVESPLNNVRRFLNFDGPWQTSGATWRLSSLLKSGIAWDESIEIWQDIDFHLQALFTGFAYKIFWDYPFDYLVKADTEDSISRTDYFSAAKEKSKEIFWNKYADPADVNIESKEWLTPVMLALVRHFVANRQWKKAAKVLQQAKNNKIISEKKYDLLWLNMIASQLSFNRISYPVKSILAQLHLAKTGIHKFPCPQSL